MRVFLDTSVLVAATLVQHIHHVPSLAAFREAGKRQTYCSAHSLAELYATLTRLPGNQRMEPDQALVILNDVRSRVAAVALEERLFRRD